MSSHQLRRIAFIGNYLPRRCGLATFTYDICHAVRNALADVESLAIAVSDDPGGYDYPEEVRFVIKEQEIESYQQAADYINLRNFDAVCLQHEYGIYGGPAGSHILTLLRELRVPIVTTLHTILAEPEPEQRRVLEEIFTLSSRVVVMTRRGVDMLKELYHFPAGKIDLIPHGIPDMPFIDPNFFKDEFGVEGKKVLLTFGLIAPNKGIEYAIRALPRIVEAHPEVVYIVLGATHPNLMREQGETYRLTLERLADELQVKKHVVFYNRFVSLEELKEFLGTADVYITPYLNEAQAVSGTLSYAFGSGKCVISTPYWHAQELLDDGRGILVPFRDSEAIASELISLLNDESRLHAMRKRAYLQGREMIWSQVGHQYLRSFKAAREKPAVGKARRYIVKTLEEGPPQLPLLRLDHLRRLTDNTGILQHARLSIPNYNEGYCLDDNARALRFAVLCEAIGDESNVVHELGTTYAAFVNFAYDPAENRFRNFLGFNREWQEDEGSEDSQGRALWALGVCVGRSRRKALQTWAVQLFDRFIAQPPEFRALRACAFMLLGICEYARRMSNDRIAVALRSRLTERLLHEYRANYSADVWEWYEPRLTYDNATLAQALLVSARETQSSEALDIALRSLRWLMKVQSAEAGHFRPIGCSGFYERGKERALFDQQPIEAGASVSTCLEAYRLTQDDYWLAEARRAFNWFVGKNDIGQLVMNPNNGGCYDGVQVDRVNLNQGAESTLAFLTALQEMRTVEYSLGIYQKPFLTPAETMAADSPEAENS